MSIESEIIRLNTCKTNIRDALVEKGISASTHNFKDFASDISKIIAYAWITVIYPEGSTITCVKDSTSANSKAISTTEELFYITEAGTWTVTCTDGTDTATSDVEITYEGQSETRELSYLVPTNVYQKVEFLQSSGTQNIDTGIAPNENIGFDFDFQLLSVTNGAIFGANISGSQASWYSFGKTSDSSYFRFDVYNGNVTSVLVDAAKHNAVFNTDGSKKLYIDNVFQNTISTSGLSTTRTIWLFGDHVTSNSVKIYGVKIYSSAELVKYFIPVYRKSDSVAGMWEAIGKTFYTNVGSGTFTVGGNIS